MSELKEIKLLDTCTRESDVFISYDRFNLELSKETNDLKDKAGKLAFIVRQIQTAARKAESPAEPDGITKDLFTLWCTVSNIDGFVNILADYTRELQKMAATFGEDLESGRYLDRIRQGAFTSETVAYQNKQPDGTVREIEKAIRYMQDNNKRLYNRIAALRAEDPADGIANDLSMLLNGNNDAISSLQKAAGIAKKEREDGSTGTE